MSLPVYFLRSCQGIDPEGGIIVYAWLSNCQQRGGRRPNYMAIKGFLAVLFSCSLQEIVESCYASKFAFFSLSWNTRGERYEETMMARTAWTGVFSRECWEGTRATIHKRQQQRQDLLVEAARAAYLRSELYYAGGTAVGEITATTETCYLVGAGVGGLGGGHKYDP